MKAPLLLSGILCATLASLSAQTTDEPKATSPATDLKELEKRLQKSPGDSANWVALARAYEARALELLEEAGKSFEDAAVTAALAESYLRAGRTEDALALIEKAGRSDSREAAYWLGLGQLAARLGPAIEEAELNRFFDRAVKHAGGDAEILAAAADYYLANGQADQAAAVCRQALEADPKAVAPRLRLSLIHEREGDLREANALLEEALLLERNNPEVRRHLGGLLLRQERYEEAIPHLRKVLELDGGGERDYGALARLMIESEDTEGAIGLLRDAAKRFPDSPDFPFLLSFALTRLDRWEEALTEFDRTLALAKEHQPDLIDARFLYRHGVAYERAGKLAEAVRQFRQALVHLEEVEAGDEDAEFAATVLNYLAYLWIERGENLDEAGPLARRALDLTPDSGAIADTVGWYHFQKGDYARALADLKRAERLLEEPDPVIFDHLGQTLAKLNEKELAADYFRRSLELEPDNAEVKARLSAVEK